MRATRSRPRWCRESVLYRSRGKRWEGTHSNLEVDKLFGECAHLVIKAEGVNAIHLGCEDEVALAFLLALQDHLAIGTLHDVIDIKRTTGLNLSNTSYSLVGVSQAWGQALLTAK